ncbi:MAG: helix-turn-helix domain-containing protein, partial [Alphaproteobacteria bacterium]
MISHGFGTDLRSRVILAILEGLSTRKAAARFGISVATSGEWY